MIICKECKKEKDESEFLKRYRTCRSCQEKIVKKLEKAWQRYNEKERKEKEEDLRLREEVLRQTIRIHRLRDLVIKTYGFEPNQISAQKADSILKSFISTLPALAGAA